METSPLATLPPEITAIQEQLADDRVKAIWRAQSLNNLPDHNGPLLGGSSHFAQLPGEALLHDGEFQGCGTLCRGR